VNDKRGVARNWCFYSMIVLTDPNLEHINGALKRRTL